MFILKWREIFETFTRSEVSVKLMLRGICLQRTTQIECRQVARKHNFFSHTSSADRFFTRKKKNHRRKEKKKNNKCFIVCSIDEKLISNEWENYLKIHISAHQTKRNKAMNKDIVTSNHSQQPRQVKDASMTHKKLRLFYMKNDQIDAMKGETNIIVNSKTNSIEAKND